MLARHQSKNTHSAHAKWLFDISFSSFFSFNFLWLFFICFYFISFSILTLLLYVFGGIGADKSTRVHFRFRQTKRKFAGIHSKTLDTPINDEAGECVVCKQQTTTTTKIRRKCHFFWEWEWEWKMKLVKEEEESCKSNIVNRKWCKAMKKQCFY